jgi:hypothetical protein
LGPARMLSVSQVAAESNCGLGHGRPLRDPLTGTECPSALTTMARGHSLPLTARMGPMIRKINPATPSIGQYGCQIFQTHCVLPVNHHSPSERKRFTGDRPARSYTILSTHNLSFMGILQSLEKVSLKPHMNHTHIVGDNSL